MTFIHTKASRVLLAHRHVSMNVTGWTANHSLNMSQVTSLLDEGHRYIPGLLDGQITLNGLLDTSAESLYELMREVRETPDGMVTTLLPAGLAAGRPAFITEANSSGFTIDATVTDAVSMTVEGQPQEGVDWGVCLHPHTTVTGSGEGPSVDDGAESTTGGVATLHVTAATGAAPDLDVVIQDSEDELVWVDLVEFERATGPTHQYVRFDGPIERYVRATWALEGEDTTATFAVAVARR
ncbi:hypothetical protein GCM10027160_28960 [Streptomyces calidiresistens]|uniref:Uncharacterized protein n=1 Tax=Streptomyces calidiresistens TaxID=1485586 RepID=A0A7W3XV21_9ACTN|nr:hypothetical protein [Streptomyces calidiresistens]MBB0228515.1 hypothetical protein [Streptomyces calidiresistens]